MRAQIAVVLFAGVLFTVGCQSVNTRTFGGGTHAPVDPTRVQSLTTFPATEHEAFAIVQCEMTSTNDAAKVDAKLREAAAAIGGDAIVFGGYRWENYRTRFTDGRGQPITQVQYWYPYAFVVRSQPSPGGLNPRVDAFVKLQPTIDRLVLAEKYRHRVEIRLAGRRAIEVLENLQATSRREDPAWLIGNIRSQLTRCRKMLAAAE